jgi:hypothetical protein
MHNGHNNPAIANRREQRHQCVSFQFDHPERLALAHSDTVCKDFGSYQREMFTLADGRIMWIDPEVANKIKMAKIQPRQEFWLCKWKPHSPGQRTRWELYLEDPKQQPEETALERDLRLSINQAIRQRNQEQTNDIRQTAAPQLVSEATPALAQSAPEAPMPAQEASVAVITPRPNARNRPGWAETLLNQTNELVDAYAASLEHAAGHGLAVKPEDVRTLLVTAFINLSHRRDRSTA